MRYASISVVIPNWNGRELLSKFLPSVQHAVATYREIANAESEIIVVDDASTDESVSWLLENGFTESTTAPSQRPVTHPDAAITPLRVVRNQENVGFGDSCNRGVREARHELIFLLNNDVRVEQDCIAPLAENFWDPRVFAAHCKVFSMRDGILCGTGKVGGFSGGFLKVHRSWEPRTPQEKLGNDYFSVFAGGGSAMFDRGKFLELGGFASLLSPFYWEDVELSYKAWKRGYKVVYEPRSTVHHKVSSTISKLKHGRVRATESRNKLLYHWIHLHDRRLMTSHLCWLFAMTLLSLVTLRISFLTGLTAAIRRSPEARRLRRLERAAAQRSDREIIAIFEHLRSRSDLIVFDDIADLSAQAPQSLVSPQA